jgi:excisionase family DNA binding protein
MLPLACRIADAAEAAGVSRSTIYEEIRQGRLPAIKIGRATRIRFRDLKSWLESRPVFKAQEVLSSTEIGSPTRVTSETVSGAG